MGRRSNSLGTSSRLQPAKRRGPGVRERCAFAPLPSLCRRRFMLTGPPGVNRPRSDKKSTRSLTPGGKYMAEFEGVAERVNEEQRSTRQNGKLSSDQI